MNNTSILKQTMCLLCNNWLAVFHIMLWVIIEIVVKYISEPNQNIGENKKALYTS